MTNHYMEQQAGCEHRSPLSKVKKSRAVCLPHFLGTSLEFAKLMLHWLYLSVASHAVASLSFVTQICQTMCLQDTLLWIAPWIGPPKWDGNFNYLYCIFRTKQSEKSICSQENNLEGSGQLGPRRDRHIEKLIRRRRGKTAVEMEEQDWASERGYLGMKSLIPVNFVILIILEPKWWRERRMGMGRLQNAGIS